MAVRGEGAFTDERAGAPDGPAIAAGSGGRLRIDGAVRRPGHTREA